MEGHVSRTGGTWCRKRPCLHSSRLVSPHSYCRTPNAPEAREVRPGSSSLRLFMIAILTLSKSTARAAATLYLPPTDIVS